MRQDSTPGDNRRRGVVVTAIVLMLVALGLYVGFIAVQLFGGG